MDNYEQLMQRALDLAVTTCGNTSPNPMVGAIVLDDQDNIVGEGCHACAGEAHAEVNALNMAGEKAAGGTIVVTLEPCSHFGRTPPCTQAIIKAKIAKVVVATLDPNPKIAGRGVQILQKAGIDVQVGVLEQQALKLNEVFFKWITTTKPFVVAKYAMSLDGKIATSTGNSKWISNDQSRCFAHKLRATYDAILVGTNTIKLDDPELTCRMADGHNPLRIVLSNSLDFPSSSKVFQNDGTRTILATTAKNREYAGKFTTSPNVQLLLLNEDANGQPSVADLLNKLANHNITSLLVEGGAAIHASFFKAHCVDKVHAIIAPKIIGGQSAPSPVGNLDITLVQDAVELHDTTVDKLGADLMLTGYIKGV